MATNELSDAELLDYAKSYDIPTRQAASPQSELSDQELLQYANSYGIQTKQPSQAREFLKENVVRPIARSAKITTTAAAGSADLAALALEAPIYAGYKGMQFAKELATGEQQNQPYKPLIAKSSLAGQVESGFDRATGGMTSPRNSAEKFVDDVASLFTGGVLGSTVSKVISRGATGLTKRIAEQTALKTPQDVAALAGASTAIPAAQGATEKALDLSNISPQSNLRTAASVLTGLAGGVAGGVAGAKAINIPASVKNYALMKDLPRAAKVEAQNMDRAGISAKEALDALQSDAGIGLDPIDITQTQTANLKDLAQIAASRKVLDKAFDAREKLIINAQNNILKGVEGNESVLVGLSKDYIDKLVRKRAETAKPLFDGIFKDKPLSPIPLNSTIKNTEGKEIRLSQILTRPDIKEALNKSRRVALSAEGTSAEKFYLGASKKLPDNHPIILHNLQTFLRRNAGNLDKVLLDADEAAIAAKRNDILGFLDNNLTGYSDARKIYSADTEAIVKASEGTLGIISDLRADKSFEAANKLSRLSPNEISKAKVKLMSIDPTRYNQAVKAFIDQKISTFREGDTIGKLIRNPQDRDKLRAMFPNGKTFAGFEKALDYIEKTKPVQDSLRKALNQEIKGASLSESIAEKEGLRTKLTQLPARTVRKGRELSGLSEPINRISVDQQQAKILAEYSFTEEGNKLFNQLSRVSSKEDVSKIMTQIYLQSGFLTTLSQGNKNP